MKPSQWMVGSNPTSFASGSFGISNIRACCREEAKKKTDIDQLDDCWRRCSTAVDVRPCQWMVGLNTILFARSFGISNIRACCRRGQKNTDIDQLNEEMVLEAFFNAVDVKPCQWMAGSNPILFASGSFGISSSLDLWPEKIPRLLCLS